MVGHEHLGYCHFHEMEKRRIRTRTILKGWRAQGGSYFSTRRASSWNGEEDGGIPSCSLRRKDRFRFGAFRSPPSKKDAGVEVGESAKPGPRLAGRVRRRNGTARKLRGADHVAPACIDLPSFAGRATPIRHCGEQTHEIQGQVVSGDQRRARHGKAIALGLRCGRRQATTWSQARTPKLRYERLAGENKKR